MRALTAILLTAGFIAGCGGSGNTATSSAGAPAGHLNLTESEYKISPVTAHAPKLGKLIITVHNAGTMMHALSVVTPAGTVRTGDIEPGEAATLRVTLSKPGRYVMYCPIDDHRALGMQATLVVAGG